MLAGPELLDLLGISTACEIVVPTEGWTVRVSRPKGGPHARVVRTRYSKLSTCTMYFYVVFVIRWMCTVLLLLTVPLTVPLVVLLLLLLLSSHYKPSRSLFPVPPSVSTSPY